MARYEKKFDALAAEPLSVPQLLALLSDIGSGDSRTDAVACFVAGADGWEQAAQQLGGAFAKCEPGAIDDKPPTANRSEQPVNHHASVSLQRPRVKSPASTTNEQV